MKKLFLLLLMLCETCFMYARQDSSLHKIKIKGLTIAYQKSGTGTPLVLLHGFTQDSRVWKEQINHLSKYFTVLAWDAPGAGLSDDPPDHFSMGDWADCLSALLDSAGIIQAHILGVSWGGVLAQEFYRRYPSKVMSLILSGTNAGWSSLSDSIAKARLETCIHDSYLPPRELSQKYLPTMFSDSCKQASKDTLARIISGTHPAGFRTMAAAIARADTRGNSRKAACSRIINLG
jgi:pimeloyl-ACP methyl ester carboxylesterase